MIIFLQPGEQVEVQFISEGSVQDSRTMRTYNEAIVVKHDSTGRSASAGPVIDSEVHSNFTINLTPNKAGR